MAEPLNRRRWIAAAACHAAGLGGAVPAHAAPAAKRARIPGEFEPQRAMWIGFDRGLEAVSLSLARALAPHVPIRVLVNDEAEGLAARQAMQALGPAAGRLDWRIEPLAIYYLRDSAVFALADDGGPAVVDLRWTHYGMAGWCRQRFAGEPQRATACVQAVDTARDELDRRIAALAGARLLPSALAAEGGGIECNGQGLAIACEALVRQRNPGLDRAALERLYRQLPGVRRVIWVPAGLAEDPHQRATITGPYVAWGTGGHTDEFVRFADARTVLLAWPDDEDAASHPVSRLTRQRMQRAADRLAAARTPDGQPLRVLRVPMPRPVERRVVLNREGDDASADHWSPDHFPASEGRREGDTVIQMGCASYLNFVIANGAIVLPDYRAHGTPPERQARVQRLFEQAFPDRVQHLVDPMPLNWLGGGLHCASLHEPQPST